MWALIQNNPGMVIIIAVVVLVVLVLHVGMYFVIRNFMRREDSSSSRSD